MRALVIDFEDEGVKYRYVIPRAQIEGDVSFTLQRTDAVTYPLTFGVLANTPKYQIISDDPMFGAQRSRLQRCLWRRHGVAPAVQAVLDQPRTRAPRLRRRTRGLRMVGLCRQRRLVVRQEGRDVEGLRARTCLRHLAMSA